MCELTPMKLNRLWLLVFGIVLLDQIVKMLVHFNMEMGQSGEILVIGKWARLHYLHNPGMAFGKQIDLQFGKLILTLFRVVSIFGIGWFLNTQYRKGVHRGFLLCLALVLGGAIGNTIDSIFYGVIFGPDLTAAGSFTPWFHGEVIDMLYFPMFRGKWPDWLFGGSEFLFFSPVFNVADSAVTIGVFTTLFFQNRFFKSLESNEKDIETSPEETV